MVRLIVDRRTPRFRRPLAVLVAALAGTPWVASAAPETLQTLRQLVEQGQYEEAYRLANASQERYEGRPEFDFNYALAAMETGHYADAIFALERVALVSPDQLRVRLELGRAQFMAGSYVAAREEFQRVLDTDPPENVARNIRVFLDRIEAALRSSQREVLAWVDGRLGADSNINSATSAETINTPIGNFDLLADGREIEDEFARTELGVRWREPLTRDTHFDLEASFQHKNNFETDEFDLGIARVEAGYGERTESGRYRLGVRVQQVTLDFDRFQESYGVVGTWDQALAPRWIGSLTGAITTFQYADEPSRDTDQYLLSATLLHQREAVTHTFTAYGAVEPAQDDDVGEHNGRDFYGVLYGMQYEAGAFTPYLRLGAQTTEYDEPHPVFGEVRDDTTLTANLGTSWSPDIEGLELIAEVRWTDVDSNLPVFDYDRYLFEFGLRQRF